MQFWNVNISQSATVKMSASLVAKLSAIFRFLCILLLLSVVNIAIDASSHEFHDFFLCRKCGAEIVELVDIIDVPSKQALKTRNKTIGHTPNILIQLFKNPQGHTFEVITASKASVYRASQETSSDTWWPGFNWIILGCPRCKHHIGWEYIPSDKNNREQKTFFGLVFGNLLHENDAENLIVLPKSYTS